MKKLNYKLVVFRCDASTKIGSGHVMRCLTLAKELSLFGYEIIFICRDYKDNLIKKISEKFKVLVLKNDFLKFNDEISFEGQDIYANWLGCSQSDDAKNCIKLMNDNSIGFVNLLVVDHYSLDQKWEKEIRKFLKVINEGKENSRLLVIDDLANRKHVSEYLLDQTFGRTAK